MAYLTVPFRWVWRACSAATSAAADRVFGYDVFVSYAWKDGPRYPEGLARRLKAAGYKVFLDKFEYVAGDRLRDATRRRVRMSSMLVVVLRPAAVDSVWVLAEVREALDARRKPVLLNVNGTFEVAHAGAAGGATGALVALLADSLRIQEALPAMAAGVVADGEPSHDVVAAVQRSFTATRVEALQRRLLTFAVAVLAASTAASVVLWRASEARRARIERLLLASTAEALAGRAQVVSPEQPDLGLALAARAWERADRLAADGPGAADDPPVHAALAASREALLRNLQRYPRLRGHLHGHAGAVETLTLDAAGITLASSGSRDGAVRLWDWRGRRLLATLDTGASQVTDSTISPDGRFAFAAAGDAVHFWHATPPYARSLPSPSPTRTASPSRPTGRAAPWARRTAACSSSTPRGPRNRRP